MMIDIITPDLLERLLDMSVTHPAPTRFVEANVENDLS